MHTYRKLYGGLTVAQYLEEPAAEVDWALGLANLDAEMGEAEMRRARGR